MILASNLNDSCLRVGNSIYKFLRDKLHLPINQEKSGNRRPATFNVLGFGFVPTYRKVEKGKPNPVGRRTQSGLCMESHSIR